MTLFATACAKQKNEQTQQPSEAQKEIKKIAFLTEQSQDSAQSKLHSKALEEAAQSLGIDKASIAYIYDAKDFHNQSQKLAINGYDMVFVLTEDALREKELLSTAEEYPGTSFCMLDGKTDVEALPENACKYSFSRYEARFLSGVAAGLKLEQMINETGLAGQIKIGYVSEGKSYKDVSEYTAFYFGVKKILTENQVSMLVAYTSKDTALEKEAQQPETENAVDTEKTALEKAVESVEEVLKTETDTIVGEGAALPKISMSEAQLVKTLIDNGCVLVSSGIDSAEGARVCEENSVLYVGTASDKKQYAPTMAITSVVTKPQSYYEYVLGAMQKEQDVAPVWYGGYSDGACGILQPDENMMPDMSSLRLSSFAEQLKEKSIEVFDVTAMSGTEALVEFVTEQTDLYDLVIQRLNNAPYEFDYTVSSIMDIN